MDCRHGFFPTRSIIHPDFPATRENTWYIISRLHRPISPSLPRGMAAVPTPLAFRGTGLPVPSGGLVVPSPGQLRLKVKTSIIRAPNGDCVDVWFGRQSKRFSISSSRHRRRKLGGVLGPSLSVTTPNVHRSIANISQW